MCLTMAMMLEASSGADDLSQARVSESLYVHGAATQFDDISTDENVSLGIHHEIQRGGPAGVFTLGDLITQRAWATCRDQPATEIGSRGARGGILENGCPAWEKEAR